MHRFIALVASTALVASGAAVAAGPAQAVKTYTACVNKSNGKLVFPKGKSKKCKKGWKKTTWTKAGPTGDAGPAGVPGLANLNGNVYDGAGALVGQAVGFLSIPYAVFMVRIDGADYPFLGNGWLFSEGSRISFENDTCTGTAFLELDDTMELGWLQGGAATARYIYRTTDTTLGAAQAYKQSGTVSSVVAGASWYRDSSGVCTAGSAHTGYRVGLTEVPAPADRPGPLAIR